MSYKFTNKAIVFLDTAFGSTSNTIVLPSGAGDLFPSISGDEMFAVVFEDRLTGAFEICYCTSRIGDQLTVTRGEEGTIAASWPVGSNVSLRTNAAFLNEVGTHEDRITQNEADIQQLRDDLDPLVTSLLERIYPVGSLYSSTISTNPGTTMAFGTWVAHAQGRALVGVGNNGQATWSAGETRGNETHTLTTNEMPSHNHWVDPPATNTNSAGSHSHNISPMAQNNEGQFGGATTKWISSGGGTKSTQSAGAHTHSVNIPGFNSGNKGGGGAHNNVQPSLAIYVWKRTA